MRTPFLMMAAVGLVASTAAAANFDVNVGDAAALDDISSGTSDVTDCPDLVTDLVTGDFDTNQNDWPVTGVRVAADDPLVGLTDLIDGRLLSIAVDDTTGAGLTLLDALVVDADELLFDVPDGTWTATVGELTVLCDTDLAARAAAALPESEDGFNQFDANPTGVNGMRRHGAPVTYSATNGASYFDGLCSSAIATRWVTGIVRDTITTQQLELRTSFNGANRANQVVILDSEGNELHRIGGSGVFESSFAAGDTITVGAAWCRAPDLTPDSRDYIWFRNT